jgi:DNA-binding MarR family transcriptional regulator
MKKTKSIPFEFNVIEENTGFLFWQLSRIWQSNQDIIMKKMFGFSQLQYVILSSTHWLALHGHEVSQSFLSNHTKIDKMTISNNIKQLKEKELINLCRHATDERSTIICLTDKGKELTERAIKEIEYMDKHFFFMLGKHLASFNSQLRTLLEVNQRIFQ